MNINFLGLSSFAPLYTEQNLVDSVRLGFLMIACGARL